jgi:hypothetical protein
MVAAPASGIYALWLGSAELQISLDFAKSTRPQVFDV